MIVSTDAKCRGLCRRSRVSMDKLETSWPPERVQRTYQKLEMSKMSESDCTYSKVDAEAHLAYINLICLYQ